MNALIQLFKVEKAIKNILYMKIFKVIEVDK